MEAFSVASHRAYASVRLCQDALGPSGWARDRQVREIAKCDNIAWVDPGSSSEYNLNRYLSDSQVCDRGKIGGQRASSSRAWQSKARKIIRFPCCFSPSLIVNTDGDDQQDTADAIEKLEKTGYATHEDAANAEVVKEDSWI